MWFEKSSITQSIHFLQKKNHNKQTHLPHTVEDGEDLGGAVSPPQSPPPFLPPHPAEGLPHPPVVSLSTPPRWLHLQL